MVESAFPDITEEQIKEGRKIACLSYLGVLFLIPLFADKDNSYSKHHAVQGLALFLLKLIWLFFSWILIPILALLDSGATYLHSSSNFKLIINVIAVIGWGIFFIVAIIGIITAALGKLWRVPIVASIAEKVFKKMLS